MKPETYKVCENVAAISRALDDDKIYPFCDGGFPDLFEVSVKLAEEGEKLHGLAWAEGDREWIKDVEAACRSLEAWVVQNKVLPTDYERFWGPNDNVATDSFIIGAADEYSAFITNTQGYDVARIERITPQDWPDLAQENYPTDEQWQQIINQF